MTARLKPGEGQGAYTDMRRNPLQRVGHMAELANLAVYLLHPASEYVNGQIIAIDGAEFQATGGNFSDYRAWTDQQWSEVRQLIRATDKKTRQENS
jgi:hypothetical protein